MAYAMYEIRSAKTGRILGRAKTINGVKRRVTKAAKSGTRVKITRGGRPVALSAKALAMPAAVRRQRRLSSMRRLGKKTSRRASVKRNSAMMYEIRHPKTDRLLKRVKSIGNARRLADGYARTLGAMPRVVKGGRVVRISVKTRRRGDRTRLTTAGARRTSRKASRKRTSRRRASRRSR